MSDDNPEDVAREVEELLRDAIHRTRDKCIAIVRKYLCFNDQRAVGYHEVCDAIAAIQREIP